ncbi:MAG: LacI family DNA-binding transcriptional regulator [Conexibacteraceae bacterium]|nr:LacI family DNA-binding transcriptional regulator [Conexibacteraceae bacterium]
MADNDQGKVPPPSRRERPPGLRVVGQAAGVSYQTVSRVLNGSPRVSPETRERVLTAMEELSYRPNPAARALATGRSHTLGLVSHDPTLYGPACTQHAISQAADRAGYLLTIISMRTPDEPSLRHAVQRLTLGGVEGVLVIVSWRRAAQAISKLEAGVPLVAVEAGPEQGVPVVAVDQRRGAELATGHLLGLGHRTVHHVAGPEASVEARLRHDGWRQTLRVSGAPLTTAIRGDWSARSGYEAGVRLTADPAVTAVFVANDQMALGVLLAMHEAGLRVPDDVSIVGFDDTPESAYYAPPLTTVRQNFSELGARALQVLVDAIDGSLDAPREPALVSPELAVRASTAAPAVLTRR